MKLFATSAVLIGLGVLLLVAAFTWSTAMPDDAIWSNEQADALQKASLTYHNNQFDQKISKIELKQAREEFEALSVQLKGAKRKKNGTPVILKWTGITSAALGAILLLVQRSSQE